MAYPQRLLTDDEEVLREFHAHWRVLLPPIGIALGLVVVASLVTAFAGTTMVGAVTLPTVAWVVAVVVGIAVFVRPAITWWYTRHILTTERIIVRHGVVSRSGVEIPLENINNVHFNQSLVERMLGYGDVLLESAGATGQSRLADIPDPEQFQSQIYAARETRVLALESGGRSVPRDLPAQLQTLSDLHDAGKLSDADFETQKRRLLDT